MSQLQACMVTARPHVWGSQFFKQYDRVLRNYSSVGSGVGMDLLLVRACSLS